MKGTFSTRQNMLSTIPTRRMLRTLKNRSSEDSQWGTPWHNPEVQGCPANWRSMGPPLLPGYLEQASNQAPHYRLSLFVCVHLLIGFEAGTWPLAVQASEYQVFPCDLPRGMPGWRPRLGTWSPRSMSPPKIISVSGWMGPSRGARWVSKQKNVKYQLCHQRHQVTHKWSQMWNALYTNLKFTLTLHGTQQYGNFQRSS